MADVSTEIINVQQTAQNGRLYFSSFLFCVHGMAYGTAYVYASLILPYQTGAKNSTIGNNSALLQLSKEEGSWSVSITPLGALLGVLASNPIGELFGRKFVLILSDMMLIIGYTFMYFSNNFAIFMTGRIVSSLALGFGEITTLVLISETATIKLKGLLSSMFACSLSSGSSFLYILAIFINIDHLIYFACIFPLMFILFSPLLLESPHWLIRKEKTEKALQIYELLRGKMYKGAAQEIEDIKFSISSKPSISSSALSSNRWTSRRFLHPLAILIPMFIFVTFCGRDAPLLLYGPIIFQQIGLEVAPDIISSLVPLGQLIGYILSLPIMTKINRRPLYMSACLLMSLSCIFLSLSLHVSLYYSTFVPHQLTQISIGASAFFISLGFGLGFAVVTYAVPGELLSPEDKSLGFTLAHSLRMISTFALIKVYPTLMKHADLSALFGCHGALIVLAAVFCWKFLPETKDTSITEMHIYFTK